MATTEVEVSLVFRGSTYTAAWNSATRRVSVRRGGELLTDSAVLQASPYSSWLQCGPPVPATVIVELADRLLWAGASPEPVKHTIL